MSKGKAYEAVVYVALKELADSGQIQGPIHWNVKPDGMSIDPDFTFGSDPHKPNGVLLVSHCGSAKNSDMKSWRNLGELGETKTILPIVPRTFCLTFGVFKEELIALQSAAFDGFDYIRLADEPAHLAEEISKLAKTKKMRDAVASGDYPIGRLTLNYLKGILFKLLSQSNKPMDSLWNEHTKRPTPPSRAPMPSSVRRGTAKLLVIPTWDMAYDLFVRKQGITGPAVLTTLGITRTNKGKLLANDPEVARLFSAISVNTLQSLYEKDWGGSVARMVSLLRNPERNTSISDYFKSHKVALCDGKQLFKLLTDGYHHVGKSLGLEVDDGNWIFDFYLSVVKAFKGAKNSYGYAQIAKDVVDTDGFGVGLSEESRKLLLSPWGNLSEWSNGEIELDDAIIQGLATALISHTTSTVDWDKTIDEAAQIYLTTYLESKLSAHRSLDPVGTIVLKELGGQKKRLPTCFAEKIGTNRSGRTECLQVKSTLIKWQSCTDSGRDHKKKELCGRAVGLRYQWSGGQFIQRPSIKKMYLVLDGTWQQSDINVLLKAGWDDVFYPDEMDRLVKAIV